MSAGRSAAVADALHAHGYSLRGFSAAWAVRVEGRETLVSISERENLAAFVQHRAFRVMQLDAARRQYPWCFA